MHWEIIDHTSIDFNDTSYLIEYRPKFPSVLLSNAQNFKPLISLEPGGTQLDAVPALIVTIADLENADCWREIFSYHEFHELDLASYNQKIGTIPSEVFFQALDKKPGFQLKQHWLEMANLADHTLALGKLYDFKVNVLRLFNRFEKNDQVEWMRIWQFRNIKKNLIRDIICDFYDLDESVRREAMAKATEFEKGWGNSRAVFPSHQLRDLIHQYRFPNVSSQKRKLKEIQNKMDLGKKISLHYPKDYEFQTLQLHLEFDSLQEYQDHLAVLNQSRVHEGIKNIFEL